MSFIFIHYTKEFYFHLLFFQMLMIMNFKFLPLLFNIFDQKIQNYFKYSTFSKLKIDFDFDMKEC
jgi:hypothetical protein